MLCLEAEYKCFYYGSRCHLLLLPWWRIRHKKNNVSLSSHLLEILFVMLLINSLLYHLAYLNPFWFIKILCRHARTEYWVCFDDTPVKNVRREDWRSHRTHQFKKYMHDFSILNQMRIHITNANLPLFFLSKYSNINFPII